MAIEKTELQIFNLPNWSSIIDLDNKVYTLDLRWSQRSEAWFIGLFSNNSDEVIIDSLKLVLNIDMLKYANSTLKPMGNLIAQSDNVDKITFENLGIDVKLNYFNYV